MKKSLLCTLLSCCLAVPYTVDAQETSVVETNFVNPSQVQTSVYWYWISGNISEEGVIKDLYSMKEAGINRAFIGNIGLDGSGKVKFYSEEWWKIFHAALKTATKLNIEIGIFNSPGWSQSGGPWVKPEQAMRYLTSVKADVSGGKKVELSLAKPDDDFQDVKVIAYPSVDKKAKRLSASDTKIVSMPVLADLNKLLDGDCNTEIIFAGKQEKPIVLDFQADKPFTLRSLKLYPAHQTTTSKARLQVKENNQYTTLAEFVIDRYNASLNVGFDPYAPIAVSVPATTAREFRLELTNVTPNSGIRELEFSSLPVVARYPEKTMAKMFQTPLPYWHEYQWPAQPVVEDASLLIDPVKVIDISSCLQGDRLTWNAPAGDWTVMRTGMLPTGVTNSPADPEATGLETDKMSRKHIEAHFDAFMGEILRRIPAADRKCWKVVVQDSYETGGQNFTDGFIREFEERFGYDPLPFLPAYDGYVVQSQDASDRFLWDVRRMVADKVAYDYVGGLRDVCHRYGLTTWLENYGHWGFPAEFLQYGGQSDEIGGEFWSFGELGDIENRAASSCGHIYGKTKISAESFTSGGTPFTCYPAMMKQRGDRFFSEGINNSLLHVYISQPFEDREPGMNAWFSSEFNRKNTWFTQIDLFTAYLKRVNYMLQQGLNVADVAYFIGEDAPKMTGVVDPALPTGYQFDYMNAEVIEKYMDVKDGKITLPHGTQYRILVLPKLETMRPELLAKIKELIEKGAVVMGPAPSRSPSLQNQPAADEQVKALAAEIWGDVDGVNVKSRKLGKGTIMNGMTMEEAFAAIDCVPDFKIQDGAPVHYGHRTLGNAEVYFVSNQSNEPIVITPEFRVTGMQPELWAPTTGVMRKLPAYEQKQGATAVPLEMAPYESMFIVFKDKAGAASSTDVAANFPVTAQVAELKGPWTVDFADKVRGPQEPVVFESLTDWSTNADDKIKYYSGTATYKTNFKLDAAPADNNILVNLNDFVAMARVKVNGQDAGGVWTAPYEVDITEFVKEGDNELEIEVVNTWVNRLIGDQKLPEAQRTTWTPCSPWKADSPLQKAGLMGPVVIESVAYGK